MKNVAKSEEPGNAPQDVPLTDVRDCDFTPNGKAGTKTGVPRMPTMERWTTMRQRFMCEPKLREDLGGEEMAHHPWKYFFLATEPSGNAS